jgi:hypothetical protein
MSPSKSGLTAGRIVHTVVSLEIRMWASLFRWILRRPVCEPGATPFGYTRRVTPVVGVFIGLSAIEIPILDLVLPWATVRVIADIIGGYGLVWMIGLMATLRVNPHVVGESGLRVRAGNGLDVTIPWDHIRAVQVNPRTVQGRDMPIERVDDEDILSVSALKETNVDVAFRHRTILELPKGDSEPLGGLRIAADEPAAMVAAISPYLAAAQRRPQPA